MSSLSSISASSSFSASQSGVQRGLDLSARALQAIAKGEVDPQNIIMLIQGQRTVETSLAALPAADASIGTNLSVRV